MANEDRKVPGRVGGASNLAPLAKYKLVFLGDQSVGKTSIITRFMYDNFDRHYQATIGIDFLSKTMYLEDRTVRLQLWDTAGQERYRTITKAYYKNADGVMIVFDLSDRESFENIDSWLTEVDKHCGPEVNVMILANKSDIG